MKRLLFALAAAPGLVGGIGAATAADVAPYYRAPPVVVAYYNWNGFYVGANVGGIWRHNDETTTNLAGVVLGTNSTSISDITAGGQIGWNYMWGANWLGGFEVDSQWTGLSSTVVGPAGVNQFDGKLDYFGTARFRAGYVMNNWLFYGTGGLAWTHGQLTRTQLTGAGAGTVESNDNFRIGWAAGAGIEVGLAPNWTARVEYLHIDTGTDTLSFPLGGLNISSAIQLDVVRGGLNYKF
jgi:outer membrane immunogenic protein